MFASEFVHVKPCDRSHADMTAERLRDYVRAALELHADIVDAHDGSAIHLDRLSVVDASGLRWRVGA